MSSFPGQRAYPRDLELTLVVPFVQTHALRLVVCRLRAFNDDTLQSRAHQFHVMPIGAIDRQADGYAVSFGQQAALDAIFASVSRVGAGFFSRPTGLWSSHRPCSGPSVGLAWPPTAKAVLIHMHGQQRLQHGSQSIRDTKASRCLVVRCASTSPFGWLFFVHARHYTIHISYSDRLLVLGPAAVVHTKADPVSLVAPLPRA